MSKPNWKRRGLTRAITHKDRINMQRVSARNAKLESLPRELREEIRKQPQLLDLV